jgi:hypothetical protein
MLPGLAAKRPPIRLRERVEAGTGDWRNSKRESRGRECRGDFTLRVASRCQARHIVRPASLSGPGTGGSSGAGMAGGPTCIQGAVLRSAGRAVPGLVNGSSHPSCGDDLQ